MEKYDIQCSFNDFYQHCKINKKSGLKVVAFPTGMGKTYGAANNAVLVSKNGDIPIFIAPRIALLNDFEETVKNSNNAIQVIRIIADTQLKQVDYYYKNIKLFKKIADSIEYEFLSFIKTNEIKLPFNIMQIKAYFSQFSEKQIKANKEYYPIFKIFRASQKIKEIYSQFNLLKESLQQEDIQNDMNSKLSQVYNAIVDIFEVSNSFYITKYDNGIYIDSVEIYKIWGFNSIDKQIVKDFFGLTISLYDIKYNKNNNYVFTMTSKKSLKYISRTFEVKNGKLLKVVGAESNKLYFYGYINNFCKMHELTPVYYIDESDEFYKEVVEERTKTIHLNNFLFKIKTLFNFSNISSLLSFIKKLENSSVGIDLVNDFKNLIFNYNNAFTTESIQEFMSIIESNSLTFSPYQKLNDQLVKKIAEKINSHYQTSLLFKDIKNKEQALFLLLCFLDNLGIADKSKGKLLLSDLYKTIKNSKEFYQLWYTEINCNFNLTCVVFFNELHKINNLLTSANLGETIIKNEDFIELAENNKFMFGNDSLSLIEEQIRYLDKLVSVDNFSDNNLLQMIDSKNNSNKLTLTYIYSFLTKVLIKTVQEITLSHEDGDEENMLDKEVSCYNYMKKMKTAFSSLKKINTSDFKIKNNNLLFDENYIFQENKNVINLFTTNYEKNIKSGKPKHCSYIQMSNINIKSSPEKEILNYYSTIEDDTVVDFSSNSVVFLMSATSTTRSYYGNFDYEYLKKIFAINNIVYTTTYSNEKDLNLVKDFKNLYEFNATVELVRFDYGIYEKRQFDLYDNFMNCIKNSNNKSVAILEGQYNKYKSYEFQSFVNSIENLINYDDIDSLFYLSQTANPILSFMNFYHSDLLNKSSHLIKKFTKKGKTHESIFIISKDIFNVDYPKKQLKKDIIVIFYDSKFQIKQENILNSFEKDDSDNCSLDELDFSYNELKKEIFNEDKYKILLCSTFGSVSKGFNFVTNRCQKEKDFDAIMIGMDPYYDDLSSDKDDALVHQRIVAMKDFNYVNGRAANLNELMDHYYLRKNYLLRKQHLCTIATMIQQCVGRGERRLHNGCNKKKYLFINNETYNKLEEFYHFYEYDRYIDSEGGNKKEIYANNLSINNEFLFNVIEKSISENVYIKDYKSHVLEQIEKNKILNELIIFLLVKVRKNEKININFQYIWNFLKSVSIFHNLVEYIDNLDNLVYTRLVQLEKYIIKSEFPNLFNFIKNKTYQLSEIFFVKLPVNTRIGFSSERCQDNNNYEIVSDYYHANISEYDFLKIVFNIDKTQFSSEVLKYIKWLDMVGPNEEIFKSRYTIGDNMYIPQKKVAVELIKAVLSEEILKNILNSYNFKIKNEIGKSSYELFDFYVMHNDKENYTAIDMKFWSIATQATNSKKIEEKVIKKTYVVDLTKVKNIVCINLFGKMSNSSFKNNIYYKNLLIKDEVRSGLNYGKYILNKKVINFLKEVVQK